VVSHPYKYSDKPFDAKSRRVSSGNKKVLAKIVCIGTSPIDDERRNVWIHLDIIPAIAQSGMPTLFVSISDICI
jgi:hypothetical protein